MDKVKREWHPIETFPKEEAFWVWVIGHGEAIAYYNQEFDCIVNKSGELISKATHWMPRSTPPISDEQTRIRSKTCKRCDVRFLADNDQKICKKCHKEGNFK